MPKNEPKATITVRHRERESTSEEPKHEEIFSQDLVAIFIRHYRLLLLGPLLVALTAYGIAMAMPGKYVSVAFLRTDRVGARSMETLVTSPAIGDKVLSKYPGTGATPEERVRFLAKHFLMTDIEPLADRASVRLFRVEMAHSEPAVAQAINADLIDAWLETTRPGPAERANVEAEIKRLKSYVASTSALIEHLQKEATSLVSPDSTQVEIAKSISDLLTKRNQTLASISSLEARLVGLPRDAIVSPPHLPQEKTGVRKGAIALLSGIASIPLLLGFLVLNDARKRVA
jgi:hypothetical protein